MASTRGNQVKSPPPASTSTVYKLLRFLFSSSLCRAMTPKRALPHSKSDPKLGPDDDGDRRPKRQKFGGYDSPAPNNTDLFENLPDDLVVSILSALGSSADSPSDLISVLLTCKRLNALGSNPVVLSKASKKSLAIKAKSWSESGHRFLKRCSDSGNLEASYILGMIRFYCLGMRRSGVSLMARAAQGSHARALYSLAVVQFNGSGGGDKGAKDLGAGFVLCARAAMLGHVDAMREVGHCFADGYGVSKDVGRGREFLVRANAKELVGIGFGSPAGAGWDPNKLLSDFGWGVADQDPHPANKFLVKWFGFGFGSDNEEEVRMCSYGECGRRETRRHEFRRCSVCGTVSYCSRACQARDWRRTHKDECVDMWAQAAEGVEN